MYNGRLRSEVKRVASRPGISCPVYTLLLQNPVSPSGRPINHLEVLSWEDLLGLHAALGKIVAREQEHAIVVAEPEETHVFKEIP